MVRTKQRKKTVSKTMDLTMVEAVNRALARAMAEDEAVIVLGQDVGVDGDRCSAPVEVEESGIQPGGAAEVEKRGERLGVGGAGVIGDTTRGRDRSRF